MTPQSTAGPRVLLAYLAVFAGVCGHASSEFVVKLSTLSGAEISVWRFMIGGAALAIVALLRSESRDLIGPLRQDFLPIVGLSLGGMAFAQFLFHLALDYASAVQVATMVTVMPILLVFVARVIDGTPISAPKLVSGIGAFIGCLLLLTDGYLEQVRGGGESLTGIALALGCATLGAFYLVLVKPYTLRYGAVRMTTYTFTLGFVALWLVVGGVWDVWVLPMDLADRSPVAIGSILTLGIWNTCIGFILWLWGLANVPDQARGNYLFFLKPVIAALLAYLILGDHITLTQIAAIIAITGFVLGEVFYEDLRALFTRRRDSTSSP